MKRIALIASFLICLCTNAQDILVKKDGSTLQIKTEEISETTIKYHLWSNLDGPIRTISVENVLSINFENGEIERFNTNAPAVVPQPQPEQVEEFIPQQPAQPRYNSDATRITIPKGKIVPIECTLKFSRRDLGDYIHKTICLAFVAEDILVEGSLVIPKGSEVYGKSTSKMSGEVRLQYILTPRGTQIPVEGSLHRKMIHVVGTKVSLKESRSVCTVKDNITVSTIR